MGIMTHRLAKYTKILNDFEVGYMAASFDMEGTIGLNAEPRRYNVRGIRFSPNVCIYNTNREILEYIQEMLGMGNIFSHNKATKKNRELFRLDFTPNQVRHLLPQILDSLIIKRRQAELVLAYLALVIVNAHTADSYESFTAIYWELRNLNARGVNVSYTKEEIDEHLQKIVERRYGT